MMRVDDDDDPMNLRVDCPEPSVEPWRDSSGCTINFPVPCVQTALCSISGEVESPPPARALCGGISECTGLNIFSVLCRSVCWA